jgi:ubiquinone biosynthesis accessory factor UbiK
MFNTDKINEISNKINDMIKSSPLADIEKNINALIRGAFTKMELVSREEFDVQAEVLRNTREKLEMLEKKLAELEADRTKKTSK